jgi:hypothetical protein
MISDILFEAREKMLGYLERGHYDDADTRRRIAEVILAMDRLRWSEGFDVYPNALLAEVSGKPEAEISFRRLCFLKTPRSISTYFWRAGTRRPKKSATRQRPPHLAIGAGAR